jgi:hypothetical protein
MNTERPCNAFKPFTTPVDRIPKQRPHKPLPGQMKFDFDALTSNKETIHDHDHDSDSRSGGDSTEPAGRPGTPGDNWPPARPEGR